MKYIKKAARTAEADHADVHVAVRKILSEIEIGGEEAARRYAREFDKWDGDIVVSQDQRKRAAVVVPEQLKADIRFAHDNVRRFAEAQRATATDFAIEVMPGLTAGQKQIPVSAAGCYVPGGRYSHVASAIMTITTAKVAGVSHIAACSPPRPGVGIPPAIFTRWTCAAQMLY